jgi:hypothetical protein
MNSGSESLRDAWTMLIACSDQGRGRGSVDVRIQWNGNDDDNDETTPAATLRQQCKAVPATSTDHEHTAAARSRYHTFTSCNTRVFSPTSTGRYRKDGTGTDRTHATFQDFCREHLKDAPNFCVDLESRKSRDQCPVAHGPRAGAVDSKSCSGTCVCGWDRCRSVEQWKTVDNDNDNGNDDEVMIQLANEITNRLVRLPFTRLHRVKRSLIGNRWSELAISQSRNSNVSLVAIHDRLISLYAVARSC